MSPADRMRTNENWRQALYNKPAVGLVLLREHITSPERFDPVFREYIRRWAFKHPTPADFFRTMEDGLGEDLSWFWRSWFYTTDRLDQAVDSVTLSDSSGVISRVYLRNAGDMPMPVELALVMDDGSTQRVRLPVEIWGLRNTYTALIPGPKKVNSVVIDPDGWYPDVDRANNRWPVAPAGAARPPRRRDRRRGRPPRRELRLRHRGPPRRRRRPRPRHRGQRELLRPHRRRQRNSAPVIPSAARDLAREWLEPFPDKVPRRFAPRDDGGASPGPSAGLRHLELPEPAQHVDRVQRPAGKLHSPGERVPRAARPNLRDQPIRQVTGSTPPRRRARPPRRCSRPCTGSGAASSIQKLWVPAPSRWKNATSCGCARSATSTTCMSPARLRPDHARPFLPDEQVALLVRAPDCETTSRCAPAEPPERRWRP